MVRVICAAAVVATVLVRSCVLSPGDYRDQQRRRGPQVEQHGRVDVLINNVGGAINFKPFTEFTDQEIRTEVDRSLMTTLLNWRVVLPGMLVRRSGVIVDVSSAATRGIRVVATAPGGTDAPPRRISRGTPEPHTEQERLWFQAHIDQTLDTSLMHRYGTLDEQAAAIEDRVHSGRRMGAVLMAAQSHPLARIPARIGL